MNRGLAAAALLAIPLTLGACASSTDRSAQRPTVTVPTTVLTTDAAPVPAIRRTENPAASPGRDPYCATAVNIGMLNINLIAGGDLGRYQSDVDAMSRHAPAEIVAQIKTIHDVDQDLIDGKLSGDDVYKTGSSAALDALNHWVGEHCSS